MATLPPETSMSDGYQPPSPRISCAFCGKSFDSACSARRYKVMFTLTSNFCGFCEKHFSFQRQSQDKCPLLKEIAEATFAAANPLEFDLYVAARQVIRPCNVLTLDYMRELSPIWGGQTAAVTPTRNALFMYNTRGPPCLGS